MKIIEAKAERAMEITAIESLIVFPFIAVDFS